MTREEFSKELWNFVSPKVLEFIKKGEFEDLEIEIFIEDLNTESDSFCNLNGFKKNFQFKGSYENNQFSLSPTHISYKDYIEEL